MLCLKIQLRFCSERDGDFPSIPFDNMRQLSTILLKIKPN